MPTTTAQQTPSCTPADDFTLTIRQAASRTGLTPRTLSDWAKAGRLQWRRVGEGIRDRMRFSESEITALIPGDYTLRPRDAARRAGVCQQTLDRWARGNRISSIVVGATRRYSVSEIDRVREERDIKVTDKDDGKDAERLEKASREARKLLRDIKSVTNDLRAAIREAKQLMAGEP